MTLYYIYNGFYYGFTNYMYQANMFEIHHVYDFRAHIKYANVAAYFSDKNVVP